MLERAVHVEEAKDHATRDAVVDVMAAVFGSGRPALAFYDWLIAREDCGVAMVRDGRRIVGTAAALALGRSGWIGGVGVTADRRRLGLGTALTEWTVDWLAARGAEVQALLASDMGEPVYVPLGFAAGETYVTQVIHGAGGQVPRSVRPYHPAADAPAARALVAEAYGECRDTLVNVARGGYAVDGPHGTLRGVALACPWPMRPVIARDRAAGCALVDALRAVSTDARLALPVENDEACRALAARGFRVTQRTRRMVRGEPLSFRPEMVWGGFSLVTG